MEGVDDWGLQCLVVLVTDAFLAECVPDRNTMEPTWSFPQEMLFTDWSSHAGHFTPFRCIVSIDHWAQPPAGKRAMRHQYWYFDGDVNPALPS